MPLSSDAHDMALYGLPLIEMAAVRARALRRATPNQVVHSRELPMFIGENPDRLRQR